MDAQRNSSLLCAECEQPTTSVIVSRAGARLCTECVKAYYIACAVCGGFVPQDEARSRDGLGYCAECFSQPADGTNAGVIDETLLESLITEYVSLHAEEKRISDRLEVIKEQLKMASAARHHEGSTVTLRAGNAAVRCNYRTSLKCDTEAVEGLSQLLGEDQFSSLFERKISFSPIKEHITEFLSRKDDAQVEARDAVRAALRETETVTLSVVATRK